MLDWLREFNRIRPVEYTKGDVYDFISLKGLFVSVLYLYSLIVLAIHDFTVSGLIASIAIPAVLVILFSQKLNFHSLDMPQYLPLFFVSTVCFFFIKNIIVIISGISELFYSDLDNIFYFPALCGIIFAVGFVLTMFKNKFWMCGGFALSGIAISCCVYWENGSMWTAEGRKFFVVYGVMIAAYCIIFFLSEGYYNANIKAYGDGAYYAMTDHTRLTNAILILLAVVFAVVNKMEGGFLDWEHIDRFISIAFSPALMFPLVIAFSIYFISTNNLLCIHVFNKNESDRVDTDWNYVVVAMMLYILCSVLYKYYFTLNFILLLGFIALLFCKIRKVSPFSGIDINVAFFNMLLADVMIATGRTGTAIVICISEFFLYKYYCDTYANMTIHKADDKKPLAFKQSDVYVRMFRRRSFWFLCIGEITAVMASLLIHVKTVKFSYGSFIGSIGIPDILLLLIMLMCAVISAIAIILFFYRANEYRPRYAYAVTVLVLLVVACSAVIKKDAPVLRVEADTKMTYLTCNIDEAEINAIAIYRGSSLPFMSGYYSNVTSREVPGSGYLSVKYPETESELCERMEYMVQDKNGKYTSYVCYYPLALSSFFNSN